MKLVFTLSTSVDADKIKAASPREMRGQAPRFPLFADDKNKIGGRHMKTYALVILLLFAAVVPLAAADLSEVKGTYSGSWTPKEGVPEAVTVELKEGQSGTLTGRFLTPALMEFTKSSFNTKANAIVVEAVDQKTGKQYKLEAKVQGTELSGTLGIDDKAGNVRLIKWTFFPR